MQQCVGRLYIYPIHLQGVHASTGLAADVLPCILWGGRYMGSCQGSGCACRGTGYRVCRSKYAASYWWSNTLPCLGRCPHTVCVLGLLIASAWWVPVTNSFGVFRYLVYRG